MVGVAWVATGSPGPGGGGGLLTAAQASRPPMPGVHQGRAVDRTVGPRRTEQRESGARTAGSAERLLERMRVQVRAYYASVGYEPPSVALRPGSRPVADVLCAAVGASRKALARMTGMSWRLPAAVGPKSVRRLAVAFGMSVDEIREVLSFITAGGYPSRKTFLVEPGEKPILSSDREAYDAMLSYAPIHVAGAQHDRPR